MPVFYIKMDALPTKEPVSLIPIALQGSVWARYKALVLFILHNKLDLAHIACYILLSSLDPLLKL